MKKKKERILLGLYVFAALVLMPRSASAMHIMEGFLPKTHSLIWTVVALPFFIYGIKTTSKLTKEHPDKKLLLALAGAYAFLLSSLKIPSVTGSCSHPTGVGLGAVMFGAGTMFLLGTIVLIFQAVLLAHGGITTLGANSFSMAIVGPIASFAIFKAMKKAKANDYFSVFVATAIGDLVTYVITSFQLAIAFPAGNFSGELVKYLTIFAMTQVPIAIIEGLVSALIYDKVKEYDGGGLVYEKLN